MDRKLTDLAGWAQAGVAGLIPAVLVIFWAGSYTNKVSDAQANIATLQTQQSKDHDKVTRLDEKVDAIKANTDATAADVKQILQNQADVKEALDHLHKGK